MNGGKKGIKVYIMNLIVVWRVPNLNYIKRTVPIIGKISYFLIKATPHPPPLLKINFSVLIYAGLEPVLIHSEKIMFIIVLYPVFDEYKNVQS